MAAACLLGLLAGATAWAQEQSASAPPMDEQVQAAGVNINTAGAVELAERLNGVGVSRAEAIVRYREQFGPFESVDELAEVAGIGLATVERNRPVIRLR